MDQQKLIISGVIAAYYTMMCSSLFLQEKNDKQPRRWWVRPIFQNRERFGHGCNLFNEMRVSDHESFFNFTRMTYQQFEKLLQLIGPYIRKSSWRQPISEKDRLLITLRFLATGNSYSSLSYGFRVGKSTIHNIIKETTEIIWCKLFEEYIGIPNKEKLKEIAAKFYLKSNMPNCVGAIDGKHCVIQAPPHSGSLYFNYKKQFSIILLGVCDSDCNFTYVNVGSFGSESDGGVFRRTEFGKSLLNNELDFPEDSFLPGTEIKYSFYLVGDEAFPLRKNLLRPYGGRNLTEDLTNFNNKLTLARRTIENTFGILANRFRVFHTTLIAEPEVAKSIIKATVVLHNFIKKTGNQIEVQEILEFGNFQETGQLSSNNAAQDARISRDILKDYLYSNRSNADRLIAAQNENNN